MVGQNLADEDEASLARHPRRAPVAHRGILLEDGVSDHHRGLVDTARYPSVVRDYLEVVLWDIAVSDEANEEHCRACYQLLITDHETNLYERCRRACPLFGFLFEKTSSNVIWQRE